MDPVLSDLIHTFEVDPDVELLNFFKSYPVTIRSRMLRVDPAGIVHLRVAPPGSVCLGQNKLTTLISNYLPDGIQANILHFDILEGVTALGNLEYMNPKAGRRMLIRVQPGEFIPVELERGDLLIRGQAVDISLIGMGIIVTNPIIKKNDVYKLRVFFPNGELSLQGSVVNVIPGKGNNRLSMKFIANNRNMAFLLDYVAQRRMEIQAEVKHLYNRAYSSANS